MATRFHTGLSRLNPYYSSAKFRKQVEKARNWFREAASQIRLTDRRRMERSYFQNASRARLIPMKGINSRHIGRMILFKYDPKHKKTLPYYDALPLVFPIRIVTLSGQQGFLGLNLHYLPYEYRNSLMDQLYKYYKDKHMDENRKLRLSYSILTRASKFKYFKPCIKQYLFTHVRSQFNLVDPQEWDTVLHLPMAQFHKQTENQVWADSLAKLSSGE